MMTRPKLILISNLLCESSRCFWLVVQSGTVYGLYVRDVYRARARNCNTNGFFVSAVEDDPDTGKHVVGRGGFPNEKGILECDAAIMDGNGCRFGAVAAIQG